MHPRLLVLAPVLGSLFWSALAPAQPGSRTPPPPTDIDPAPDMGPPVAAPPEAADPAAPDPPAHLTPPTLARDRLFIDAALDAVVVGDLRRAEALFNQAMAEASTPEVRMAAALLAQRTRALASRRSQLPPPSLTATRRPTRVARPASARPVLLLTTTLLGVAAWGWSLPMALGVDGGDDGRAVIGLYMTTAAASFAVPYLLTRSSEVTWGQANLVYYGGTRGLEYGLLVSNLLFGEDGGHIDDDDKQAFAASLLLGSMTGAAAGGWWAKSRDLSAGDARTVAAWGDYGLFAGFVTGHAFGLDVLTGDFGEPRFDARARSMAASGLIGTALGLTAGRGLSLVRDNTWGDGEVMRGAGLLGVLVGATTAFLFDYEERSRGTLATMAIGGGLGMVGGDRLVRDTNFSMGEAILIDLSLATGGLGAAGITYLATPDADPAAYMVAASVGAGLAGGFAYHVLRDNAPARGRAGAGPGFALVPRLDRNGQAGVTLYGSF